MKSEAYPADSPDIDALRRGDDSAFSALVRENHRALLATATAIVGIDDAEEVVQNSWIKAHKALPGFEGRSALRTWLTRIVINEARMLLRKTRREVPLELGSDQHPLADRFRGRALEPATCHLARRVAGRIAHGARTGGLPRSITGGNAGPAAGHAGAARRQWPGV